MKDTIKLIKEIEPGDIIEHHCERGTYAYKVLYISKVEKRPINFKITFISKDERDQINIPDDTE